MNCTPFTLIKQQELEFLDRIQTCITSAKPVYLSYSYSFQTCMVQESVSPASPNLKNANISNLNVGRDTTLPLKAQSDNVKSDAGMPFKCSTGTLLKKVVPSDNSCLFASVYYLINGEYNVVMLIF